MSLLLLFHPGVSGGVTPPTVQPTPPQIPEGGGINPREVYLRKRERIEADEEELLQIIALVVPLIGRH